MTTTPTDAERRAEIAKAAAAKRWQRTDWTLDLVDFFAHVCGAKNRQGTVSCPIREVEALRANVTATLGLAGPNHARHNLDGAIIDIDHNNGHADEVCMQTLRRVKEQIADVERALLPDPATQPDTIPDTKAEEAELREARARLAAYQPSGAVISDDYDGPEVSGEIKQKRASADDMERARAYRSHDMDIAEALFTRNERTAIGWSDRDDIAAALSAARARGFTEGTRQMQERARRLALAYADTKPTASQDDSWSACARELAERIGALPDADR